MSVYFFFSPSSFRGNYSRAETISGNMVSSLCQEIIVICHNLGHPIMTYSWHWYACMSFSRNMNDFFLNTPKNHWLMYHWLLHPSNFCEWMIRKCEFVSELYERNYLIGNMKFFIRNFCKKLSKIQKKKWNAFG